VPQDKDNPTFTIPGCIKAVGGSTFCSSIIDVPLGQAREEAILQQYVFGNVPAFLRKSKTLVVTSGMRQALFEVLPDVLCVGTDEDFVRTPMNPMTAQRVADLYGATLITPFLSDLIWRDADLQLAPIVFRSLPDKDTSTACFVEHNQRIESYRLGNWGLIAGHKKDIVLTSSLSLPPFQDKCVGLYGWHQHDGTPLQGLVPVPGGLPSYSLDYVDYSYGVRLISLECKVDGAVRDLREVAVDPELSLLFTGVGPLTYLRYPLA
jgi:hypothetical protein